MIPLTKRQKAAIQEASRDRLSFASATDRMLTIKGKDYTPLIKKLTIPEQDGPAVALEGILGIRLPESIEQEECRVYYIVKGERILGYIGKVVWMDATGFETTFHATTPYYKAENTPIGKDASEDLDYFNASPSDAMYEVVSRIKEYRGIDIKRVDKPLFTREGGTRFLWSGYVSKAVEEIQTETSLILEDTPLSTATARLTSAVIGDSEPVWTFEEGRDFEYGGLSVKSREEGRYAWVVAWRANKDGSTQRLAQAKVDNRNRKVDPDSTFFIEQTDTSTENAHQAVRNKAVSLAENSVDLTFPCVYIPLHLTRGDPVLVKGREITADGTINREYRARLTSVSPDVWNKSGALKAIGGQTKEVFEPRKRAEIPRLPDAFKPLYGRDFLGRPYISDSLTWASYDPVTQEAVLNVEEAQRQGVNIRFDEAAKEVVVS